MSIFTHCSLAPSVSVWIFFKWNQFWDCCRWRNRGC